MYDKDRGMKNREFFVSFNILYLQYYYDSSLFDNITNCSSNPSIIECKQDLASGHDSSTELTINGALKLENLKEADHEM